MTVDSVTLAFLLLPLLLYMSEIHTAESSKQENHTTLLPKRRFLSPRDLQGSYSRFLEVSENSTLCPNTVTHNTNGVLYPNGYIHMPLHEVSQDGFTCAGPGDLIIRFRRRISSKEIENEFNITANASGIDKMVRDILLALDGFYFGTQTKQRSCQSSYLPANTKFFFTSQSGPFAANVGAPFRHDPNIMFLVDKNRVCAFRGLFTPGERLPSGSQSVPNIFSAHKPGDDPLPKQKVESPSSMMKNESPRERTNNQLEIATSAPQQTRSYEQNSLPTTAEAPAELQATLAPSMLYKQTPGPPEGNLAEVQGTLAFSTQHNETSPPLEADTTQKHGKGSMTGSTPLPKSGTGSVNENMVYQDGTSQHRGKKKRETFVDEEAFLSPLPSKLPQHNSDGSFSLPQKHSVESLQPSSSPSRYPTKELSQASRASLKPLRSPAPKSYEIRLHSASPRVVSLPSSSASPPRPHPLSSTFKADDVSPSPSQKHMIKGEAQQSFSASPKISATILTEPSASEVVIGDSSSTCFPSSATVVLRNGKIKRMDELLIGTSVSVGRGEFTTVIDFSHSDPSIVSKFLHLQTDSGRNLTLTGSHFVYTDHGIIPAVKVIVGDYLKLSDGRPARVVRISKVWSRGLYNPQTMHGAVVVNGFVVSTYTLAAAPMTAHALLAPVRFLYDCGFRAAIVSKLANQQAIVRVFASLLAGNMHSTML